MICFVVPPMTKTATISGGNLYNLGLTSALTAAGASVEAMAPDAAAAALAGGARGRFWVDSLFLEALPPLRALAKSRARVGLLAHYLPTLVSHGAVPAANALTATERAALAAADGFVVPSAWLAGALATLGAAADAITVVAPGVPVPELTQPPPRARLSAIVVATLVPGKGVLPFLRALPADAPIDLLVVGSVTADPAYAAACREAAPTAEITGALAHADTLQRIAAADVLVSPSRMESFGLALAEARALGVPIVARAGGNAAAHVEARAGGVLVDDDAALAAECVRLAGDANERARRRAAAGAARPPARSWADAARDFLAIA